MACIFLFTFIEAVYKSLGDTCANLITGYQSWPFKILKYSYSFYFNYCLIQLLVGKEINFHNLENSDLLPHAFRWYSLLKKKKKQNFLVTLLNAFLLAKEYALF